ncbi:MAG: PfkB family carbohydrate kinase [Candidatus Thermoplasmatota archaeon]|nr:PfkB family carbohydrate kinase [Candidatus Thermoplasmatota archaeon]
MAWVLDEIVQAEVDRLKRLRALVDGMPPTNVTLVGDSVLDRYVHGWANRLNATAPVPAVKVTSTEEFAGAAAHVARGLVSLGLNPSLFSIIGGDEAGQSLASNLTEEGINTSGLRVVANRQTIVKTRIYGARESLIDQNQLLLQIDDEPQDEMPPAVSQRLTVSALASLSEADVLVLSDYNKGAVTDVGAQQLISAANGNGIPTICDPKLTGLNRTEGATCVLFEVRGLELTRRRLGLESSLETARNLIEKYQWEALVVLGGTQGLWLYTAEDEHHIPCMLDETKQIIGLHDAAAVAMAAALSQGATLHDAATLAHAACETILGAEEGQEVLDRRTLSASLDERAWQMQVSDR